MENEALMQAIKSLHTKITNGVNPDNAIDVLHSKNIISNGDYRLLCHVFDSRKRCRDFMSLLHLSSHPQTFIELRLALVDEYSWIVDEIDEQLASLTAQQQQPHQRQPTRGQFLSVCCY